MLWIIRVQVDLLYLSMITRVEKKSKQYDELFCADVARLGLSMPAKAAKTTDWRFRATQSSLFWRFPNSKESVCLHHRGSAAYKTSTTLSTE